MDNNELLKNVEPLQEMIMATSILSNNSCVAWKQDSEKLIDFICDSYNISHLANEYKELILNTINNLSLVNEYKGLRREHNFNDEYSAIEIAYNLKGQVLLQLKNIDETLQRNGFPMDSEFNYEDSNSYYAPLRLMTVLKASSFGDVQLTNQAGLMYLCGIGANQDIYFAIVRLKQAAYWGYIPALKYLANIYKHLEDEVNYKLYEEVYDICNNFFYDGIQMLPEEKKDCYSKEAATIFTLLTNIYQDVVIPHTRRIDYSFLEVMFAEKISFAKKMIYINEYPRFEWKSALNSTFFSNDIF